MTIRQNLARVRARSKQAKSLKSRKIFILISGAKRLGQYV